MSASARISGLTPLHHGALSILGGSGLVYSRLPGAPMPSADALTAPIGIDLIL